MSKLTFAQSSDIRSRSGEQYRIDMKKKAISELECLPLLQQVLAEKTNDESVVVRKHGSDALRWFDLHGKISQDPDYQACWPDDRSSLYEFQIALQGDLDYFDFKVSKVRTRKKLAHPDREFFYILKPERMLGFLSPQWIMDNGKLGAVPAWGNRTAYRVPRARFLPRLESGGKRLESVLRAIDDKTVLLDFQRGFVLGESARLGRRLRRVVDDREQFRIVPGTTPGFFETCLLMQRLDRYPEDAGVWLVYLFSFLDGDLTPKELAQIAFSIDFLYFRAAAVAADSGDPALRSNEQRVMLRGLQRMEAEIRSYPWDTGSADPRTAPLEELRQMLFVVNLFEDWRQDVAANWEGGPPPTAVRMAERIFELVPDVAEQADRIRAATGGGP